MKEKTRFFAKVEAIQNRQYRVAMEVSSYNQGRDVAQVPGKTWIDGTRKYLRPDTMWADERYAKITQEEINQAKQRVAQKNAKKHEHKHHDDHHVHHEHNYDQVAYKQPKAMYP